MLVKKQKTIIDYKKMLKWIYVSIIFAFAFFSYYYTDLKSLTIWSTNIWDTILYTGDIRNFYLYSAKNIYGLEHELVGSDILIYFPWAIWNLPIWLIQQFGKIAIVNSPLLLLYSKCFLVVVLLGVCKVIKKIYELIGCAERTESGIYLFLSSPFVLFGIAYVGQNDIVVIFLYLCALYYYLLDDKKKFIVFSALCIACKPFFLFSFVALVLLREKKLDKIFLSIVGGLSVMGVEKLLFVGAPMYKESLQYGPTQESLNNMLASQLAIPPFSFSLFLGILFVIYFVSYCTKNVVNKFENAIYYSFLPLICFFAFAYDKFYRPIYLFALWNIVMILKKQYFRINLFLEMLFTTSFTAVALMSEKYCLSPQYLIWNHDYSKMLPIYYRLEQLLQVNWMVILITCSTVSFVALILMGIINSPFFNKKNEVLLMEPEGYLYIVRGILYLVPLMISVIFALV